MLSSDERKTNSYLLTSDDPSDSSSVSLFIIRQSSPFVDDCMISEPEYALDVSLARECELRIIDEWISFELVTVIERLK